MILDIDTKKSITRQPHPPTWRLLEARLTRAERENIIDAITERIGEDDEIKVAAFMPGSDWTDTPFQIIFEKAARNNFELAGLMFGLLAWEAFKRHPDEWLTLKTTFSGRDVENRVYFRRQY
jgi:hypothetical protein